MAKVEAEYKGIKGVMTDGYFPSFSYFKNIDWETASKEKFPLSDEAQRDFKQNLYHRYLGRMREEPKAGPRSNFYRKMEGMLEDRFCQYNKERCAQFQFPGDGVHRIEKIISVGKKEARDKLLPAISNEIEHDLIQGKETYIFHLGFFDLNPENYCPSIEACTDNWMRFMGYRIKAQTDYLDFGAFKNAVEFLLRREINEEIMNPYYFEGGPSP